MIGATCEVAPGAFHRTPPQSGRIEHVDHFLTPTRARGRAARAAGQDGARAFGESAPVAAGAELEVGGSSPTATRLATALTHLARGQQQAAKENLPSGFKAAIGETVPNSIMLQPPPASVSSQVPALNSYEYTILQSEVLIVDPSSKKIVDIIAR
jgi:hypothetical protein